MENWIWFWWQASHQADDGELISSPPSYRSIVLLIWYYESFHTLDFDQGRLVQQGPKIHQRLISSSHFGCSSRRSWRWNWYTRGRHGRMIMENGWSMREKNMDQEKARVNDKELQRLWEQVIEEYEAKRELERQELVRLRAEEDAMFEEKRQEAEMLKRRKQSKLFGRKMWKECS